MLDKYSSVKHFCNKVDKRFAREEIINHPDIQCFETHLKIFLKKALSLFES